MAVEIGYKLSSEEFDARALVRQARAAEEHGFTFALIADHFHPWLDSQGQSPFVWSVLGAIAETTSRLRVGTGVTCPIIRIHPAIVAQAAATMATMMPGRFFLGVGSGENLNEHIVGARWPPVAIRHEMLEEAVAIVRQLWSGGMQSHHGKYFTLENARLYSLPETPPPLYVAASGPKAAKLAARIGDGLVSGPPNREVLEAFSMEGGAGKPRIGELPVCYDRDIQRAQRLVKEVWPLAGFSEGMGTDLALPSHFASAAKMVAEERLVQDMPIGPDPEPHLSAVRRYIDGGYDLVYVHQIGPDQDGFMNFYAREILPALTKGMAR